MSEAGPIQSGVASAEIAFTPELMTNVLGSPALLLPLDDPLGARRSRIPGGSHSGACASATCPTTGAPGRFGDAVLFDGTQSYKIAAMSVPTSTYTLGIWFNTTSAGSGLFSVQTSAGTDRQVYLSGGNVCADVFNGSRETICSADVNYADGQWHQAIQVLGGGMHQLYVDGELAASGIKGPSDYRNLRGDLRLGVAPAAQSSLSGYSSTRSRCSTRRCRTSRRAGYFNRGCRWR